MRDKFGTQEDASDIKGQFGLKAGKSADNMPKPDLSISALGIELRPLEKKDLPLLCHWRNQPEILPYMDTPRKTSIANLVFWYEKIIGNKSAISWLVYYYDTPVAYTELTQINHVDKSCVGGLFLFGEKFFGTGIAYRIILCRDILMSRLDLEILYSRIHKDNQRSIDFCTKYGAELIERDKDFNIYRYDPDKKAGRLKLIAKALKMADEYENALKHG